VFELCSESNARFRPAYPVEHYATPHLQSDKPLRRAQQPGDRASPSPASGGSRLENHGLIGEHGQDTSACERAGWMVKHLPLRRSWWPPFRPDKPLLRSLRTDCSRARRVGDLGYASRRVIRLLAAHADFSAEIASHLADNRVRRCHCWSTTTRPRLRRIRWKNQLRSVTRNYEARSSLPGRFARVGHRYDLPEEKHHVLMRFRRAGKTSLLAASFARNRACTMPVLLAAAVSTVGQNSRLLHPSGASRFAFPRNRELRPLWAQNPPTR